MASQDPDAQTQAQLSDTTSLQTDQQAQTSPDTGTETETNEDAGNSQVSLMDMSYDEHTVPEPPADRVSVEEIDHDTFFECSVGDVLWVDDTEYVVVDRPMALLTPSPLLVVSQDGTQGELIAGELPRGTGEGVTWKSNVADKESHEISRSDLLCSYDRVYKLEQESLKHVHQWTPDVEQRECPACDEGRAGEPLRIERQASKAVELRQCSNTDCKYVYRFVREFPEGDEAAIVTYDNDEAFETTVVDGVFRCEEQDDFKFPVETNKGRDDGFFTASEIAEFVNPKMVGPDIADILGDDAEDVSASDVLDELSFTTEVESLSGSDDEETRPVESLGELYELYVDDRLIPMTEELREALEGESRVTFFRVMKFLRQVIPDKPTYGKDDPEPTGYDVEPEEAVELAARAVTSGSIPDDDNMGTDVRDALSEALTDSLTGEDIVTDRLFRELIEDHTDMKIFGVVDVKTNRSGELVVEWRDAPGFQKKMRITFTRIEDNQIDQQRFGWYMERHDLSEIAP